MLKKKTFREETCLWHHHASSSGIVALYFYVSSRHQNTRDVNVSLTPGDLSPVWRGRADHDRFDIWGWDDNNSCWASQAKPRLLSLTSWFERALCCFLLCIRKALKTVSNMFTCCRGIPVWVLGGFCGSFIRLNYVTAQLSVVPHF